LIVPKERSSEKLSAIQHEDLNTRQEDDKKIVKVASEVSSFSIFSYKINDFDEYRYHH
jgi:hypothetical protein